MKKYLAVLLLCAILGQMLCGCAAMEAMNNSIKGFFGGDTEDVESDVYDNEDDENEDEDKASDKNKDTLFSFLWPTTIPTTEITAESTVIAPTVAPTAVPTVAPTTKPVVEPATVPTVTPTAKPTAVPTTAPMVIPTAKPTVPPTTQPVAAAPIVSVDGAWTHIVALRFDGTVSVVIENGKDRGQGNTEEWTNIIAVCAGYFHTVGLKADGTVVAVGSNDKGQCNVSGWRNIVAITAGDNFTVGLKSDGTLVAAGDNRLGQCDVAELKNIVQIDAQGSAFECLDVSGNWYRLGETSWHKDNGNNLGIVSLGTGHYNSVGLQSNGQAIFIQKNELVSGPLDISNWNMLCAVSTGSTHIVGLKSSGNVVAVGKNEYGECNVSGWIDIVDICAGHGFTVGVKADGTVVATGKYLNTETACDVSVLNEGIVLKEGVTREITWDEVEARYADYGDASGFLLECGFTCEPYKATKITAECSFKGEKGNWIYSIDGPGYADMYFSFWIPNDPSLEGWQSVSLYYDGTSQTVSFYLDYLGDYSHILGTSASAEGLGWTVKQWKVGK